MNIFIKLMGTPDANGNQISFGIDAAQYFFSAPDGFIKKTDKYSISVCLLSQPAKREQIELQPATDYRFSTKLNAFLLENGIKIEQNDLLYFEKAGRGYGVKLVKPADRDYQTFSSLVSENRRQTIIFYDSNNLVKTTENGPRQQIFYGAPGTGKSHKTNEVTSQYPDTVRTTFHPDSDYSTFVGAYKPTMCKFRKSVILGQDEKEVHPMANSSEYEEKIVYKFVKQAFLKAYILAWKKMAQGGDIKTPQFLVIEEINRGNCAQIFGDLFQLLDRKCDFSEYPIESDEDIRKALLDEDTTENPSFGTNGLELSVDLKNKIDEIYDKPGSHKRNIADRICKGQVLVLPPNLFIWATMNTSDQSLFPIDSAFKRRWEWKYIKIADGVDKETGQKHNWKIQLKDKSDQVVKIGDKDELLWWDFLQQINKIISSMTSSADKQLGYYFCKAKDGYIDAETFVGKVVFYLWNDVFKDYAMDEGDLFKYKKTVGDKTTNEDLTFPCFYTDEGTIEANITAQFIQNVMNWGKEQKKQGES